jgi:SPP1 gp7 family putative phage head morphogenesis protein
MKPFKTPHWRQKLIDQKYSKQDKVIAEHVKRMESVMAEAVDYILEHYQKSGRFVLPSLNAMDGVSESFYRDVVTQGVHSAQDEKKGIDKHESVEEVKHLSRLPIGVPKSLKGLEKLFRDKRYWPLIMKRSKMLTDRVRKVYLRKLQVKFKQILPMLDTNQMLPKEARGQLMEAWQATKPRVELIFRTETSTYFGKTQTAFFNGDKDIIGFLFDSIRDRASTIWCRDRHGLVYRPGTKELHDNTPAIHWSCRSCLIPLADTPTNRKLLEDASRNPAHRHVTPLPAGWRT